MTVDIERIAPQEIGSLRPSDLQRVKQAYESGSEVERDFIYHAVSDWLASEVLLAHRNFEWLPEVADRVSASFRKLVQTGVVKTDQDRKYYLVLDEDNFIPKGGAKGNPKRFLVKSHVNEKHMSAQELRNILSHFHTSIVRPSNTKNADDFYVITFDSGDKKKISSQAEKWMAENP